MCPHRRTGIPRRPKQHRSVRPRQLIHHPNRRRDRSPPGFETGSNRRFAGTQLNSLTTATYLAPYNVRTISGQCVPAHVNIDDHGTNVPRIKLDLDAHPTKGRKGFRGTSAGNGLLLPGYLQTRQTIHDLYPALRLTHRVEHRGERVFPRGQVPVTQIND